MRPDPRRFKERAARRESFLDRGAVHKPICPENSPQKENRAEAAASAACPARLSFLSRQRFLPLQKDLRECVINNAARRVALRSGTQFADPSAWEKE